MLQVQVFTGESSANMQEAAIRAQERANEWLAGMDSLYINAYDSESSCAITYSAYREDEVYLYTHTLTFWYRVDQSF